MDRVSERLQLLRMGEYAAPGPCLCLCLVSLLGLSLLTSLVLRLEASYLKCSQRVVVAVESEAFTDVYHCQLKRPDLHHTLAL